MQDRSLLAVYVRVRKFIPQGVIASSHPSWGTTSDECSLVALEYCRDTSWGNRAIPVVCAAGRMHRGPLAQPSPLP